MWILAISLDWMNYPGLEIWKFINLAIFLGAASYVLRRPLSDALRARRTRIADELLNAQQARDVAQKRLDEAEALLAGLDKDVEKLREQARQEAMSERQRLERASETEIEKLNQQAQREIDSARRVTKKLLREFLAGRSVQLAGESVRVRIRPEDDTRLINSSIEELGRARR